MAANPDAIPSEQSIRFYQDALRILREADIPHLVGGAHAFARYTGIGRHTKDFDVFIRREDFGHARVGEIFAHAIQGPVMATVLAGR